MSRYARKKDSNHNEICEALEADGYLYHDTSRLPGFVDAVIGGEAPCPHCHKPVHKLLLVEIKAPGGKLEQAQAEMLDKWGDHITVAFSEHDVTRRFA